jgi:hypothetical protein
MGFGVLCIIAMPFFGVWVWVEEKTPTSLVLSETELTARHMGSSYVIRLSDIESVELLREMPWLLSRDNGASFTNLSKGRFTVSGYGSAFLIVQTNDPPFLVITAGGRTYILNDADSGVTREVYTRIG